MLHEKHLINQPSVTVILPVGPDSLNIQSCLESLIQQRYNNIEIIIIDNGLKQKTLERLSRILEKSDFKKIIWKQEYLKRRHFWNSGSEIHGDLIFLASPYVIYDRDCIKHLVIKLEEDQKIKVVNPERLSSFDSMNIMQKCLTTIDSSIKLPGDAFGGTATNGILFWKENIDEIIYWDLMQDGYLEPGITRIQFWSTVFTVKDAQCQPNQPRSLIDFFRSVYLEARYKRPYLSFRTHTYVSAISMVLLILAGVFISLFFDSLDLFGIPIILIFLIPLYIGTILPNLFNWRSIAQKWTILIVPLLRILSSFVYLLGILQKHFRFDKILSTLVNTPEITILPTTLFLQLLNIIGYTLITKSFLEIFYLGFTISLTLFKKVKFVNHLFYGFMLSTPINLFLSWLHEERELVNIIPPSILAFADPLTICLIFGGLFFLLSLFRYKYVVKP